MIRDTSTGTPTHFIFSLNVDTGNLNPGWPVDVNATARSGSTVFNSLAQGQRGALAIVGTNPYVPCGGLYGDCGTYYGWVVGVPVNNPHRCDGVGHHSEGRRRVGRRRHRQRWGG